MGEIRCQHLFLGVKLLLLRPEAQQFVKLVLVQEIKQRLAAQSRKQNAIWANPICDGLDAVSDEPGKQVAAAPEVARGACLGDELLDRPDVNQQEGGLEFAAFTQVALTLELTAR